MRGDISVFRPVEAYAEAGSSRTHGVVAIISLVELKAIRSTLDERQGTTGATSVTTSTTGTAADDRPPGEDDASHTDLVSGDQSDKSSSGDHESDGER